MNSLNNGSGIIVSTGAKPDFDQVKKALEIVQRYSIVAKLRAISPSPLFAEVNKKFALEGGHLNLDACFYDCPIMELNVFIDEVGADYMELMAKEEEKRVAEEKAKAKAKRKSKKK